MKEMKLLNYQCSPKNGKRLVLSIWRSLPGICMLLFLSLPSLGQDTQPTVTWHDDGSVEVSGGIMTFTDNGTHMFDYNTIPWNTDFYPGYIKAYTSNPTPYPLILEDEDPVSKLSKDGVSVTVRGNDHEIYGIYNSSHNLDHNIKGHWWFDRGTFNFKSSGNSDNIKKFGFNAGADGGYSALGFEFFQTFSKYPVSITANIRNARFKEVKIPGVGTFTAEELFGSKSTIRVYKPDSSIPLKSYIIESDGSIRDEIRNANATTIEATMGDRIEITVTDLTSKSKPTINGLAATWLAPVGREYYYHCDPSIVPGAIKPKIPFEVQSHYVSSNHAPVEHYPDWIQDPSDPFTHTLTWTVQRRTDPIITKYQAQYKFKKADELNGKTQRKSKSEGQIMDFLWLYKTNRKPNNSGYTYDASLRKYYWNIDSDELIYFDNKEIDTKKIGWTGHIKRVPLYEPEVLNNPYSIPFLASADAVEKSVGSLYEPWQVIREGDYTWGDDGYPKSGFVINELVDEYRQHHNKSTPKYRGYEIEDHCLYKDKHGNCYTASGSTPALVGAGVVYNGAGNGSDDNNKHPGLITINNLSIPLRVVAPLGSDEGFYGNIETPSYSNVKSNQTLKVKGLNITHPNSSLFTLETRSFSLQDFPLKTYTLGQDGTYDSDKGTWEIPIETDYNQGQVATLKYNGVIISGAEWKNTTIPYIFSRKSSDCSNCMDLNAGSEDFIDNYVQKKRYAYDYSQGFVNNYDGQTYWPDYIRHYVLHLKGERLQLSSLDALDNIWDRHGGAYYWGYRALAKQITDATLKKHLIYRVTDLATGKTTDHPGRHYIFDPKEYGVGDYELQVVSKGTNSGDPSGKVKIKVVDFHIENEINNSDTQLGNIYTRKLYQKEREILGLDDKQYDKYRVASVNDILAKYLYVDGPRAKQYDGNNKNRFAVHNDFNDKFYWYNRKVDNEIEKLSNIQVVQNKIDAFHPTELWKVDWKNWLRHFSFGHFPKSVVDATTDQTKDADNNFRSYVQEMFKNENFKLTSFLRGLIWLAPTEYDGYRINGLMKTIVDLEDFFNNHAFSGIASPGKLPQLPAFVNQKQDISDDAKYRTRLYRKLKDGGMIIYDPTTVQELEVYNTDKDGADEKFVAGNYPSKIPLMIGQDLQTIQDYGSTKRNSQTTNSAFPVPAGVTSYLNLYTLTTNQEPTYDASDCETQLGDAYGGLGEDLDGNLHHIKSPAGEIVPYNHGGGPLNTRQLADTYPNSDLNIGLSLTNVYAGKKGGSTNATACTTQFADIKTIPSGTYDAQIKRLAKFCKSRINQTIYLRIGYEFDLIWNLGYETPNDYIAAFQHIVTKMNAEGVTNVKYVWQASVSPFNYVDYLAYDQDLPGARDLFGTRVPYDPWKLEDWYPGSDFVDIVGVSWFENPDSKGAVAVQKFGDDVKTQRDLVDRLLNFAREKKKPVMVAEATPRGYDIGNLTKSNTHQYWDGEIYSTWSSDVASRVKKGTKTVTAEEIWDDFYRPLFDYVYENGDVIKYFHYIDANWTSDLQWQWTSEFQYWGDARVQANTDIKKKWINEINKPQWLHGNTLHSPAKEENKLTFVSATHNSATFKWNETHQPQIGRYRLRWRKKGSSTYEHYQNFSVTPDDGSGEWEIENEKSDGVNSIDPGTDYVASLIYLDYYGKQVGEELTTTFTTLADSGARVADEKQEEDLGDEGIAIYPNPTQGELNIAFGLEEASDVRIELIDMSGRLLFHKTDYKGAGNHQFKINNLHGHSVSQGVILVKVTTNKSKMVRRIVLE